MTTTLRQPQPVLAEQPATPRARRERQLTFVEYAHALTERARSLDPSGPATALACVVIALSAIGMVVQASHAATTLTQAQFYAELSTQAWFRVAGITALLAAARVGPSGLRRFLPALWAAMLVLLVLVFVPPFGKAINGAHRWLEFGRLSFQPSELARLFVVMFIADRCVRLGERVWDIRRGVAPTLALGLAPVGLVLIETDLGAAALMLTAVFATMWVGGARPRHVFAPLLVFGPAMGIVAFFSLTYIRRRVEMFLGLTHNQQVADSFAAIAGGDFWGVGLARGLARNQGVPHLESDFVFAQLGEELGLAGMLLVLALWALFLWNGLKLVLAIKDRFDALASFGILFSTLLQATLHVCVVAGIAPPKGMTLPFVSHGGTSLIASSLAVGLALGAARRSAKAQLAPAEPAASASSSLPTSLVT